MTTKIYSIHARDVVRGMVFRGHVVERVIVQPEGVRLCLAQLGAPLRRLWRSCIAAEAKVDVQLPGPSPRDLCPDLASQLSLWPVPFHGKLWNWNDGDGVTGQVPHWWTESGGVVTPDDHGALIGDADELTCFYLPAEQTL
jgi:hypothetical protein